MKRVLRFFAAVVVVALIVAAGAGVGYVWFQSQVTAPGPLAQPVTLIIAPRSGLSLIARQLADAHVVEEAWMPAVQARWTGQDRLLKPGEYKFDAGISLAGALDKIVRHDVVPRFVTVPEGLVTAEILEILDQADGLNGDITSAIAEGDLLPETYRYEWGDAREGVVARMRKDRDAALRDLWDKRAAGLPFNSPEEAVALASIVERETGLAAERPHVAAVFVNRLKRGMKLQSDPTVIFGLAQLGPFEGPLTTADLEKPTPFNTYVIAALPPSPICHPGRAALAAVLNPMDSSDLYFVADGSGGHAFAPSLEEHNRNVAHWRELQRQNRAR